MPITLDFMEAVKALDKNWSMGVELVSPLIHNLIRCTRPRSVLEVGAGYSTLFILQALSENLDEFRKNKEIMRGRLRSDQHVGWKRVLHGRHPLPLALPEYYHNDYCPRLSVIDDLSNSATSAGLVESVARRLQLDHCLRVHNGDFRGMLSKFNQEDLPFDFVWFDCGAFEEYADFLSEYWDAINLNGGLLLLHSTLTNELLRPIISSLKEKQIMSNGYAFEMLNLLEPHKWRQNSVTVIRMVSQDSEKIYSYGP